MSYSSVQTSLYNVILKLDEYTVENASEMDPRFLANGVDFGVVLRRPATGSAQSGMQDLIGGDRFRFVRRDDWVVRIELWVQFLTDTLALRELMNVETQRLLDHIDKWPHLDGNPDILDVSADVSAEPSEWQTSNDLNWFRQDILVNIREDAEVLVSEKGDLRLYRYGDNESVYGTATFA